MVATKPKPATSNTDPSAGAKLKASTSKKERDRLKGVIVKKKTIATKDKILTKQGGIITPNSQGVDILAERKAKRRKTDEGGQPIS